MKKIVMILTSIIIIIIGYLLIYNRYNKVPKTINGNKPYYVKAGTIESENDKYNKKIITTYEEYKEILDLYEMQYDLKESDFDKYDYLTLFINIDSCSEEVNSVEDASIKNNKIVVTFNMEYRCGVCAPSTELYFIRFDKNSISNYKDVKIEYNAINRAECEPNVSYKPVIYLYPTKDMNVSVKLGKENNLLVTYPKYNDGWNVYAKVNGDLIDSKGRKYYALYWEGLTYNIDKSMDEGFIVKGGDTIEFLEDKLELLGLNERESNEFIMYWLPILQNNKYNYIRFATIKEIDNSMPLDINPKPDTTIRVLMVYKPLDEKINIKEQIINTPKRTGFTVVEWGGTKL